MHPSPYQPPTTASTKPIIIGLLAIFALIAIFIVKNYSPNQQNDASPQETAAGDSQDPQVPLIQPEDVAKLIFDSNYQLTDIREQSLFDGIHIEGSINLPFSSIENYASAFDKHKKIIVIDTNNSLEGKLLTQHLINGGLDARLMEGGFDYYYLKSLPTISAGNPDSVHDQTKATPLAAKELNDIVLGGARFNFVDVRPEIAFKKSHIEGAINIPLEQIENRKKEVPVGKVITCDDDPLRSFQAAVRLYDLNFWGVYYLSEPLDMLEQVSTGQVTSDKPASGNGNFPATEPANTGSSANDSQKSSETDSHPPANPATDPTGIKKPSPTVSE